MWMPAYLCGVKDPHTARLLFNVGGGPTNYSIMVRSILWEVCG